MRSPVHRQAGFTLIELLVAVAIVAILIVAQVTPFQQTIASRDHAEAAIQAASAARLTLLRLAEELGGALGLQADRGHFVVLDRTLDRPSSELRFATTGARRVQTGARDPVDLVRYYLDRAPDGSGATRLLKDQLPSVAAAGVDPITVVVLDDVVAFRAEVLTGPDGQWASAWEATSTEVPRAVRLSLEVRSASGPPTRYRTTVTLPMGESRR